MSHNKDTNKKSYQGSCKGARNTKPYDKNQSLLSRVKNAVQGYFIPSWVQAVISPETVKETGHDFSDPTENGCVVASATTEVSKLGAGFFQNSIQALGEGSTSTNLKRRQMDSCSKDDLVRENLITEPQSKRRALERSVEFVEDDPPSTCLRSTPVARSSIRHLKGSSLAFNQSHMNSSKFQDPLATNLSLFSLSSKLKTPERATPMSPFYNGPVSYGGANACRQQAQGSFDGTDSEEHQVLVSKRNSNLGLSKTTQKILKVLESNKTQHIDKMGLPPLTFDNERHKSLMTEVFSKGKKSANGPPVKEMSVPTQLSIKPNYAFMNSGTSSNEGNVQDGKYSSWTGKIRREREKHHEFRGQDTKTCDIIEKDDLNSLSRIKLPPITLMPLSSTPALSSFSSTFTSSSSSSSTHISTGLHEQSSVHSSAGLHTQSSDFKFSLPHFIQGKRCAIENVQSSDMSFKFSEPKSKDYHQSPTSQPIVDSLLSGYQIDFNAAMKKSSQAPSSEGLLVGPAKELKIGSVMDVLKKDSDSSKVSGSSQNSSHGSSLKELFKMSSNSMWQCPTCLVSNKNELSVCPCCSKENPIVSLESSSNSFSNASAITITTSTLAPPVITTSSVTISSQPVVLSETNKSLSLSAMFSAKPGEWNCEVCMIRNKAEVTKCLACETNKPGSKNSEPGPSRSGADAEISKGEPKSSLSAMFSAKPGEWNCEVCMIRNKAEATKCPACETIKPGMKTSEPSLSSLVKDSNQDTWKCDTCTMQNSQTLSICPFCSSSKSKLGAGLPKTEPSSSLSALFAAKPGEWNCEVCMVRNKADITKCAACETDKPGTEAAVGNSKKGITESSPKVVIKAGTGGFTFGSSLTSDFTFKSESVKSQESEETSGGFKPSFECFNSATASSGFTALGGGFKFTPSLSQAACTSISQVQSLPSTSTTPSDVAVPSVKTGFNGQPVFNFEQSTKTTSTDENLNNSNSLFASSKIRTTDEFTFGGISKELKTTVTSNYHFGSNPVSKDSSNISTFGLSSIPVSTSFSNTSASGFTVKAQDKLPAAQFGLSNNPSAPTASLKPFSVSDTFSTTFEKNPVSGLNSVGSNPSLPIFGHTSTVSGTRIVTNNPPIFGQNLTTTSSASNNSTLGLFGQTSKILSTNTNIPSVPLFGQTLTAANTTSIGNNANMPLFGQSSIVTGITSVANNPSLSLFGKNSTAATTVNIGINPPAPIFGQDLAVSSAVGTFSFGSSQAGLFAKPQQNSSNLFGQISQSSSTFAANTISTGSGFSFKNSDNATGVFGGTQNSVGNVANAAIFNYSGTRSSSNGDDMMMESPQPTLPPFVFNKTSSDAGFSFGSSSNNGPNLFGATNAPASQGISFPSISSFNFGQAPTNLPTNQQTPQFGQQPATTAQTFSFGATPSMNFASGNVTFSAGGSQGNRVIKKAARRITRK